MLQPIWDCYTLDSLWKSATQGEDKNKYLTLATYTKLGRIQGILTKRTDAVLESLNKQEKSVAKTSTQPMRQSISETIHYPKYTQNQVHFLPFPDSFHYSN